VPSSASGGLILLDASFATEIHDRLPARVSTTLPLPAGEDDTLVFWMSPARGSVSNTSPVEGT
jgi:hypothetical protein